MIWEELELVHDTLVGGVAARRVRDAKDDEIEKRGNVKRQEKKERKLCQPAIKAAEMALVLFRR